MHTDHYLLKFTAISYEISYFEDKEYIVIGHFNYDILKHDNCSKSWLDLMQSVNFSQLVESPTRLTLSFATLIDHAFSNIPQNCFFLTFLIQ
jgi:hypothetical protein